MKNKNGQALVEFIIILPIILFILFACIDTGRIIYEKNKIETGATLALQKYNNGLDYDDINKFLKDKGYDVDLYITKKDDLVTITLIKSIDFTTPGINKVLKSPYSIEVERTVADE